MACFLLSLPVPLLVLRLASNQFFATGQQMDPRDAQNDDLESLRIPVSVDGDVRQMGIVLDANYRWVYNKDGKTCDGATSAEMEACFVQGVPADRYKSDFGISVQGGALKMRYASKSDYQTQPNYGSRVFLIDSNNPRQGGYAMFDLLGKEITFTLDLSNVPAGVNAAVYLVAMDPVGNLGAKYKDGHQNGAGWKRGLGYCDAQCPTDLKFVGDFGYAKPETIMSCCPEMDIFEGNRLAAAMTAHPCTTRIENTCDMIAAIGCTNPCDADGADANMFRRYGPEHGFYKLLDLRRPVTVRTQFHTDQHGDLSRVEQTIEQVFLGQTLGFRTNITDEGVARQKALYGENNVFEAVGGLAQMGQAMARGMVLSIAIWADPGSNMDWLESCNAGTNMSYDCDVHKSFDSADVFLRSPLGAWRGPVDHFEDFDSSFGDPLKTLEFSYPGIPTWSRSQSPLTCPMEGNPSTPTFNCSEVPYEVIISSIGVTPLVKGSTRPSEHAGVQKAGGFPWYGLVWFLIGSSCIGLGGLSAWHQRNRGRTICSEPITSSSSEEDGFPRSK